MAISILIVAPEPAAERVAQYLRRELDASVDCAGHQRSDYGALHRKDYSLLLLDENLAAADPEATHALYASAGNTPVLEMNLAICGPDRVLRHVRAALNRRVQDEARARSAATAALSHECSASLTGLLLESQLALQQAGPEQVPALERVVGMAAALRDRFRTA